MSARLGGRRAVVTGGSSGIGAEIVRRFREEGASVLSVDLEGGDLVADVSSSASVNAAVEEAVVALGGLDTIVCNAGTTIFGAAHELAEADWDRGIATNLKSVYLCATAAWPHLRESHGSILATASSVGLVATAGQAAYCTSKAAVIALIRCMALDGAGDGIRANCVCPGSVESPMLDRFLASRPDPARARRDGEARHPLGFGRPVAVADAFVYLASDDASWVTGVALSVDGGFTAGLASG